jgi:molybdopterin converting factor subunit 1
MRILFFAHLKTVVGRAEIDLATGDVNVEQFWHKLLEAQPALQPFRTSVRLARNSEYVGPNASLSDTDEIALIPPVSGG